MSKINVSNTNLPAEGDSDERVGTVIAEYEIDSVCFAGNAKIIQSLGPRYDKEALRVANLMVAHNNNCRSRCHFFNCEKRKEKIPLTFTRSD